MFFCSIWPVSLCVAVKRSSLPTLITAQLVEFTVQGGLSHYNWNSGFFALAENGALIVADCKLQHTLVFVHSHAIADCVVQPLPRGIYRIPKHTDTWKYHPVAHTSMLKFAVGNDECAPYSASVKNHNSSIIVQTPPLDREPYQLSLITLKICRDTRQKYFWNCNQKKTKHSFRTSKMSSLFGINTQIFTFTLSVVLRLHLFNRTRMEGTENKKRLFYF